MFCVYDLAYFYLSERGDSSICSCSDLFLRCQEELGLALVETRSQEFSLDVPHGELGARSLSHLPLPPCMLNIENWNLMRRQHNHSKMGYWNPTEHLKDCTKHHFI